MTEKEKMLAGEVYSAVDPGYHSVRMAPILNSIKRCCQFLKLH